MRVYVAGPYSTGNLDHNLRTALKAAEALLKRGYAPYVPHLNHLWQLAFPHSYETWLRLDMKFLHVCGAVWRLPGESPGADREVRLAKLRRIPVCYSLTDFPPL